MKNRLSPIFLMIVIVFIGCKKENSDFQDSDLKYDCFKSSITYTESNRFQYQENFYYLNNLIVRIDCSPNYILNYEYDNFNNLTKYEFGEGYYLYEYDNLNRCILSERFIEDELFEKIYKHYSDTILTKEILLRGNNDTLLITDYYYNGNNEIDSVISSNSKTYHSYSLNRHIITKFDINDIKLSESITSYENGLITKLEEYYYNLNGELFQSFIEAKVYDENKNLIKLITEQNDFSSNYNTYDEARYLYDAEGRKIRDDLFDANSNLLRYNEYIYEEDKLVKRQSYDSAGNKIGYTKIDNTCD
jgi:hypothetical protein